MNNLFYIYNNNEMRGNENIYHKKTREKSNLSLNWIFLFDKYICEKNVRIDLHSSNVVHKSVSRAFCFRF